MGDGNLNGFWDLQEDQISTGERVDQESGKEKPEDISESVRTDRSQLPPEIKATKPMHTLKPAE